MSHGFYITEPKLFEYSLFLFSHFNDNTTNLFLAYTGKDKRDLHIVNIERDSFGLSMQNYLKKSMTDSLPLHFLVLSKTLLSPYSLNEGYILQYFVSLF